jgi:hypothetical protein
MRAPTASNVTSTALTAGAASAALDSTCTQGTLVLNVACSCAYSIRFGTDGTNTVTSPTDTAEFAAGVSQFTVNKNSRYFKVNGHANGQVVFWIER